MPTLSASDLTGLSAIALRRLIGARQLSPVELLDACIARIEALNPFVNAICATKASPRGLSQNERTSQSRVNSIRQCPSGVGANDQRMSKRRKFRSADVTMMERGRSSFVRVRKR